MARHFFPKLDYFFFQFLKKDIGDLSPPPPSSYALEHYSLFEGAFSLWVSLSYSPYFVFGDCVNYELDVYIISSQCSICILFETVIRRYIESRNGSAA